jgi:hypothetical protein
MRFTVRVSIVAVLFAICAGLWAADDAPKSARGVPSTAAASAPSVDDIKALEARFDAAQGPQRSVLGLEFIGKLKSAAQSCYKSADFPGAIVYLNKALAIAGKIKADTFELTACVQEIGQIKNAADRFAKAPKNADALRALIIAYVAHGDPAKAGALLDDTVDQAIKTNVQLSARGIRALSDQELLGLGKWLASDKIQATRVARETLLAYLERSKERDADFADAATLFHTLNKKGGYLFPDRKASGSWEFSNGVLRIGQAGDASKGDASKLALGPVPDAYSISMDVRSDPEMAIVIPVGKSMCSVSADSTSLWLNAVKGERYGQKRIPKAAKRKITIKVVAKGDSGAIEVLVDGKSQLSWSGAISDLTLYFYFKIPDGSAGIAAYGPAQFSDIAIDCKP